jgi:DNA-binding response OmpR family regulator
MVCCRASAGGDLMSAQPAVVLLIEDDRIKRQRIREAILQWPAWRDRYQFAFIEARDYPGAFDEIEKLVEPPLFTVMDSKLPGVPAAITNEQAGASLCRKLRSKRSLLHAARFREWIDTPVIFYSGLTDIDAHLSALDAQATTYVEKDKSIDDLLRVIDFQLQKRARAALADEQVPVPELTIEIGPLRVVIQKMADTATPLPIGQVLFDGREVELTRREFILFALIMQKLPAVCTFDALQDELEELGQKPFNSKDTADKAMSPIRQKFEAIRSGFIEQCLKHDRYLVTDNDLGGWTWRDPEHKKRLSGGL